MAFLLTGRVPPFVELLLQNEKGTGVLDKIKNACVLKSDGEKGIDSGQHDGRPQPQLGNRKHREKRRHADDADVLELPQPQGGLGSQVVGVDIHRRSPHIRWEKQALCDSSGSISLG